MSVAEGASDEAAREAAIEIATQWHYARFAIPDRFDGYAFIGWFRELTEWLAALYLDSPALWFALMIGLFAVALALLAHVIWSIRLAMRASEVAAAPSPRVAERELAQEADALAHGGRFLEAAHTMQLACVERLVEHNVIELRRHDPNPALRERLARAQLEGADRSEFLRLLGMLEQRWFRDRPPEPRDADLFSAWRALYARLGPRA